MAPQRTTTLDFIDYRSRPPQWPPIQPRTAPRGLEAAQRPRLASANPQPPPLPSLPSRHPCLALGGVATSACFGVGALLRHCGARAALAPRPHSPASQGRSVACELRRFSSSGSSCRRLACRRSPVEIKQALPAVLAPRWRKAVPGLPPLLLRPNAALLHREARARPGGADMP